MKTLTQEQVEALYKLVEQYDEDFDYDVHHHENGNFDDSYEYGVSTGENYILGELKGILEEL